MSRGMLTEEIKKKYGITTTKELRLIPYLQYLLVNNMPVDPYKIDNNEREILKKWRDEGKITFSYTEKITVSKAFWNWMNDVIWEAYVPHIETE